MVKINLSKDIESWYIKEIGYFFKRSKTYSYKQFAKIVKSSLGLSFKKLLLLSPDELEKYATVIKAHSPSNFTIDRTEFMAVYKKFRSSVSSKKFIEKVNLKVCPYCNRNYIFNFKKNKKNEATAQLDHFFDKSTYPYFALSMYNLVPSCSICNQRKSKKDVLVEPIYNPYKDNIHNHISFKSNEILSLEELKEKDLDFFSEERIAISIEEKTINTKTKEHLTTFNIEGLYNNHKDIVCELYQKRVIYSDSYIDELLKNFSGEVFNDRDDLLRLITCGYVDDESLNKRPLSKLIKDISTELGLY